MFSYLTRFAVCVIIIAISISFVIISSVFLLVEPLVPNIEQSILQKEQEEKMQVPMRVYTKNQDFIAEFAQIRRSPIEFEQIPQDFLNALVSAEDKDFWTHKGVDTRGIGRAFVEAVSSGELKTGGSTLTMQLVKVLFLTNEKSIKRKIAQILLAFKLEREMNKEQIITLYANIVFFGHRAYGIAAASQVYFGTTPDKLTLAQSATLAALPQSPSEVNPIKNPIATTKRRNWILDRMFALKYITKEQQEQAKNEVMISKINIQPAKVYAPYVAEEARIQVVNMFGEEKAYSQGYSVFTTIDSKMQEVANIAMRKGLLNYDMNHGFRGVEKHLDGPQTQWHKELNNISTLNGLEPAVVTNLNKDFVEIMRVDGNLYNISFKDIQWARKYVDNKKLGPAIKTPTDVLQVGDVIRVLLEQDRYVFVQIPKVQGSLISLDPNNGYIKALVGGFSFEQTTFNRAMQARRQPGSSFKPFIYSAALDNGYTASSLLNDAPIVLQTKQGPWIPKNDDERFLGPITLRRALYLSRNMPTIRTLDDVGIETVADYVTKFGFSEKNIPKSPSLALGTADLTPMEISIGWSAFANGGHKIEPHIIEKIINMKGEVVYQANPKIANYNESTPIEQKATQILDPRTSFIISNILQDVINRGTGVRAKKLNRHDLSGKTGTTNDAKDTWFAGFNAKHLAVVWTGFDQPQSLGKNVYGSNFSLPIWIDYMEYVLQNMPNSPIPEPKGLIKMTVDSYTGFKADSNSWETYNEYFKQENPAPKPDYSIFYEDDSYQHDGNNTNYNNNDFLDIF